MPERTLQSFVQDADGVRERQPRENYVPTAEERLAILDEVMTEAAGKGLLHTDIDDQVLDGRLISIGGTPHVSFGSCSYLGLELDPRMREAVIDAVNRYGTQFSSSRAYLQSPAVQRARAAAGRDVRRARAGHADDLARPPRHAPGDRRVHRRGDPRPPGPRERADGGQSAARQGRDGRADPPQQHGAPRGDDRAPRSPPQPHLVHGRRRLPHVRRPRPVRGSGGDARPSRAAAALHRRLARRRLGGQARPRPGARRARRAPARGRLLLAEQVVRGRGWRDGLPGRRDVAQGAHRRRPDDLLRPDPAAAARRRDRLREDPPLRRAAGACRRRCASASSCSPTSPTSS